MDKNQLLFTVIPEDRPDARVSSGSALLLNVLQLFLACLAIATVIVVTSVLYNDLNRRYNSSNAQDCSNPELYMRLGYNLGLLGPNLTSDDMYSVFINTMMSTRQTDNGEEHVEEGCKGILLESYAIGVKNSEASAEEISDWLQKF